MGSFVPKVKNPIKLIESNRKRLLKKIKQNVNKKNTSTDYKKEEVKER